ncbi:hypothetical protein C1645_820479 [Glomus cerebriforme]|uniref:Uncharacterized protein n=1 Tax=Glomus cerebriforme TaxID=658196 RepID=A0A397T497_9GLOM|nr:hypothetical protein C1645_820479 [Glomus cerebriforme]
MNQIIKVAIPIVEDNNLNISEFNNLSDDDLIVSDNDNDDNKTNNIILNETSEPNTEESEDRNSEQG